MRKAAMKNESSRKRKHCFFFAETKLKNGQIKRKIVAKLNKQLFFFKKKQIILKVKLTFSFRSNKTSYTNLGLLMKLIRTINSECCLGLFCSLIGIKISIKNFTKYQLSDLYFRFNYNPIYIWIVIIQDKN